MKQILNCCAHPVILDLPTGRVVLPETGIVARVEDACTWGGMVELPDGHEIGLEIQPVVTQARVMGLPGEKAGRLLVVSRLVAEALPTRQDLVYPVTVVGDGGARRTIALGKVAT